MERRKHDRLTWPGRRQTDGHLPAADGLRVILVGADEGWRLVTAYLFEEAGYSVYAATDRRQAVAFTTRLLPDVVIAELEELDVLDLLSELSAGPTTRDIPVVVLTASLKSREARHAREAGAITFLTAGVNISLLVEEVDTLIAAAPRARRTLKRRLLDLQEIARYCTPNAEGQARLRALIDHLQVAMLALDEQGRCIAASDGATALTGYTRLQLLTESVLQTGFVSGLASNDRWRDFLADWHYAGTTTITNCAGEDVRVHAAAVAEILPGFHVAAFAAA